MPPSSRATWRVLGKGTKRLFEGAPRRTLRLVDSVAFATGVVVHTYHPAHGEVDVGPM